MADISLHIDGQVVIQNFNEENPVLAFHLHSTLPESDYVLAHDTVYLHGNKEQIKKFAELILKALSLVDLN